MYSVSDRLERLPFSSFHFRLLMIGGLGLAFEALDAGIIAAGSAIRESCPYVLVLHT